MYNGLVQNEQSELPGCICNSFDQGGYIFVLADTAEERWYNGSIGPTVTSTIVPTASGILETSELVISGLETPIVCTTRLDMIAPTFYPKGTYVTSIFDCTIPLAYSELTMVRSSSS